MKLLSTLAHLCISKRHCCAVLVEIRYTQRSTLCVFLAPFSAQDQPVSTNTQLTLHGTIYTFGQHYLVTAYMASIVVIQSLSVCALSFFPPTLSPPLPLSHFKFALNTFLGKGFSFISGVCPGDKRGASCISISAKTMLSL